MPRKSLRQVLTEKTFGPPYSGQLLQRDGVSEALELGEEAFGGLGQVAPLEVVAAPRSW